MDEGKIMNRALKSIAISAVLLWIPNAFAQAQEPIHVACDGCTTYQQYRTAAIRATDGMFEGNFNVEISNVVQREVWDFEVFREREPNGVWLIGAFGTEATDERLSYLDFFVEIVMSGNRPQGEYFDRWNISAEADLRTGDTRFHSFADARMSPELVCGAVAGGNLENLKFTRRAGKVRQVLYNVLVVVDNGDMFVVAATSLSHATCTIIDESALDKDLNRIDTNGNAISGGGSGFWLDGGSLTYLIHMGGTKSCARWESDGLVMCIVERDEE